MTERLSAPAVALCVLLVALLLGACGGGPGPGVRSANLSPVTRAFDVPVISLHGSRDAIVPLAQSGALGWRRVELVPGAGHFDLIDPRGDAFERLLRRLRAGFAA